MFEHVIRNPFDMKPIFNTCEKPSFNTNDTDVLIQAQKRIELDNLGKNIYFETSTAIEEELVEKTAAKLGLFNEHDNYQVFTECNDIKQLGLAIEDDVVIMHNGKRYHDKAIRTYHFDSLDNLTFRVEHERTVTITEGTTAVFLIHVDIYPLKGVLKTDFGLIKESIDSMSKSVLQYKNLVKVKELLSEHILST